MDELPDSILEVSVTEADDLVSLLGIEVGYEDGKWRYEALTFDLIAWASDWILTPDELKGFGPANSVALLQKALSRIYSSSAHKRRGEVGELLLHIILRRFMDSKKVISRLYFKDAANDTVKGFDAVHIVERSDSEGEHLELWLGESKFYKDSSKAIKAVIDELRTHLETSYLRQEFAAILDKVPVGWEREADVRALLNRRTSLDVVFKRVVIPVFITFDSEVSVRHSKLSEEYLGEIEAELRAEWADFRSTLAAGKFPREVRVHLILMPMASKDDLIDAFDGRLKAWQTTLKV